MFSSEEESSTTKEPLEIWEKARKYKIYKMKNVKK